MSARILVLGSRNIRIQDFDYQCGTLVEAHHSHDIRISDVHAESCDPVIKGSENTGIALENVTYMETSPLADAVRRGNQWL